LPSGSRSTLFGTGAPSQGRLPSKIVGRRFSYATHDVVRGWPRGRPRLRGARRRRAGTTFLAVQRQRGVRARWPGNPARTPWWPPPTPCVSNATGLDNLPSPLGIPARRDHARNVLGGHGGQPRERDRRAPGRRRHRPRREPRRPAPAGRGDDDARRPRRQRAGLRHVRGGLARARRLQRGPRG
jgi:hypothetical protein